MNKKDFKEAKPNDNWLLLGSIDLCNSTYIKSLIDKASSRKKMQLYDEYCEAFSLVEFSFYKTLFENYSDLFDVSNKFSLERKTLKNEIKLNVLKHIGDEIWFCFEIRKGDVQKLINNTKILYDSIYDLKKISLKKLSKFIGKNVDLKFKSYLDLTDDYREVTRIRAETFFKFFNHKGEDTENSFASENLLEQFDNGYIIDLKKGKLRLKNKTDYISYETDRFFRFKSYSVKDFFCIGEKLFTTINEYNNINFREDNIFMLNTGKSNAISYNHFYYISKQHKPKGIDKFYKIYYLEEKSNFNNLKNDILLQYEDYKKDNNIKISYDILLDLCNKYGIEPCLPNIESEE